MHSNRHRVTRKASVRVGARFGTRVEVNAEASVSRSAAASTDLYDLWLNSTLPAGGSTLLSGVTSSSSHQLEDCIDKGIDSERLAETLMQLSCNEIASQTVEERL